VTDDRGRREKPVTRAYLQRAAVSYLERYASSSANLRRVLQRKVLRRGGSDAAKDPAIAVMIDEVVATTVSIGLVDDARYAEMKAASLRRRGGSRLKIAAKLAERGIGAELSQRAIDSHEMDDAAAARRYAERRRLGPWRREGRVERRDRDMAAMARAGFSFELARRVIDAAANEGGDTES
jgi:regulatory protein